VAGAGEQTEAAGELSGGGWRGRRPSAASAGDGWAAAGAGRRAWCGRQTGGIAKFWQPSGVSSAPSAWVLSSFGDAGEEGGGRL
jgi:hypothetical protein